MQTIALSPAIQDQIAEAQAELARRRLKHFCLRMNPRLKLQPYHNLIFDTLEAMERGEGKYAVFMAPPRHSKTEIVARKFVAWLMGRRPESQVILASYGTDLARNASRDARNLFAEPLWPFPDAEISKDSSSAEEWSTTDGGKVKAAGVGAGITGYGADYLIVDDPFKGAEDAFSKAARDKVWDWYVNEARTRLMPGGKIILICTRWHQDDLIGRALAEAKEDGRASEWTVIRLPAIAEENDPAGRKPGEPLDPERYPASYLKQFMGISRTWNALYQQNPIPDTGSVFLRDWWLYYDPEELERRGLKAKYIYVDPAFGGNAKNDETAATVWGTLGGKLYWMDTLHERVPYHELKKRLGHFYAKWHVPLVVEDSGWSQILINELRSPTPGDDGLISFPVIPYKLPGGNRSKTERAIAVKTATAESVTAMVEGGMVFLPRGASWLDYALDQLTEFPAAKHDDVVDSVVMALTHMGVEHSEAINHFYFKSAPVVYR